MSYSFSTPVILAADARYQCERAWSAVDGAQHTDEAEAAVEAAIGAVEHLRGAVGGTHLAVTVSGHANPGHEPAAGWSRDQVHVSVASVLPPEPGSGP